MTRLLVKQFIRNPKIRLFALLLLISTAQAVETLENSVAMGTHGMVLFSDGKRLFASHLAMHHFPHNFQVVLEIHSANDSQLLALAKAHSLITLEPERFDLRRLNPEHPQPLTQFNASIYQGHFERGGSKWQNGTIHVQRVWVFHELAAAAPAPHYYRVGELPVFFVIPQLHHQSIDDSIYQITHASKIALPMAWTGKLPFELPTRIYHETADFQP